MIITGEISSTDLVAWGEQGEWIEAGQVSDFQVLTRQMSRKFSFRTTQTCQRQQIPGLARGGDPPLAKTRTSPNRKLNLKGQLTRTRRSLTGPVGTRKARFRVSRKAKFEGIQLRMTDLSR